VVVLDDKLEYWINYHENEFTMWVKGHDNA
jgi:hypothetical protein